MKVQFDILEKDFNIKPNIVVAYIDQTDFGDEICRYKNNRVFDGANNLVSIKPSLHEFPHKWKVSELNFSNKPKFMKSFEILNFKIAVYSKRLKNKFLKLFNLNIKYCSYQDIQSYLIKINNKDREYFFDSIKIYLDNILSRKYVEKIIIITFPHKQHFLSENKKKELKYNVNVSNLIDEIIFSYNNVYHLNFSDRLMNNKNINIKDLWISNDISSHIKPFYHEKLITKAIIEKF